MAMEPVDSRVRLYGTTEILGPESTGSVGRAKERAVLAYLATRPGDLVTHDALLEAFWADREPDDAIRSLRVRVANLRKICRRSDIALDVRPSGYVLDIDPGRVDAFAYRSLVADARNSSGARRLEQLEDAEALRSGTLLSEFIYDDFAREMIAADASVKRLADQLLAEAAMEMGRYETVIAHCTTTLEQDPTDESAATLLARCLALTGRSPEGIRTLTQLRTALGERGLLPSGSTLEIEDALLLDRIELLRPVTQRLPRRPRLIGRDEDVTALLALVELGEPVSVIGPPGVGKSSVVLELAHRLAVDGTRVAIADLTEIDTESGAISAVARAVGSDATDPSSAAHRLGAHAALILDNCDRVLGPVGRIVHLMRSANNDLRVVMSSRQVCSHVGARRFPVAPLPIPDIECGEPEENPAVGLFLERARRRLPSYRPSGAELESICELVRQLDGLPLALDLAAARLTVLSPSEILGRMSRPGSVLSDGDQHGTHRSLVEAIRWSTGCLADPARTLLGILSVFRGPFDLKAVEDVSVPHLEPATLLDAMHELERCSLISVDTCSTPRRHRLLGVIAEHARTLLTAEDQRAIETRHRHHYLVRCRALQDAPLDHRLIALDAIMDNVRAAIESGFGHNPEASTELLVSTFDWWHRRARWDQAAALAARIEALAVPADRGERRRFYATAARSTLFSSDSSGVVAYLDAADGLAEATGEPLELRVRALATRMSGDIATAIELHRSSVEACNARGVPAASDLANIAECEITRGRLEAARAAADEAILELGAQAGADPVSVTRAEIAMLDGDLEGAMARAERWLSTSGASHDAFTAHALIIWGLAAVRAGKAHRALERMPELLRLGGRLGGHHLRNVLLTGAVVAEALGRDDEAAEIASGAAAIEVQAPRPWELEIIDRLTIRGSSTTGPLDALRLAHAVVIPKD